MSAGEMCPLPIPSLLQPVADRGTDPTSLPGGQVAAEPSLSLSGCHKQENHPAPCVGKTGDLALVAQMQENQHGRDSGPDPGLWIGPPQHPSYL